jgi:sugar transferase (PEP-CTERM/EpsH1 system associated)
VSRIGSAGPSVCGRRQPGRVAPAIADTTQSYGQGVQAHEGASGFTSAAQAVDHGCRAVQVMHVMYALQPGGMELGVVKLVNGLDGSRVRSSICSTTAATQAVKALVSSDVPIFELERRSGNDPKLVWHLYRLFRSQRPDIVHTHAWGTLVEGLIAARLARVPIVVHGEHGTLQQRPYQLAIQRWAWGRADQVLSVSYRLAERMAAVTAFPVSRLRTIQNGVDTSRFGRVDRLEARRRLALPLEAVIVGTAGRLVPVKDHANFIDALARLRTRQEGLMAVISGDGPLRAELEARAAERQLTGRVTFLGHRSDIEDVFAALDVFVLPSRSEGMSNTILEAMASGRPVVATHVGGADELVEHGRTGLLVPPADSEALAEALAALTTEPGLRARMADAARLKAERAFSLRRMLLDYQALYVTLATSHGLPGVEGTARGHT